MIQFLIYRSYIYKRARKACCEQIAEHCTERKLDRVEKFIQKRLVRIVRDSNPELRILVHVLDKGEQALQDLTACGYKECARIGGYIIIPFVRYDGTTRGDKLHTKAERNWKRDYQMLYYYAGQTNARAFAAISPKYIEL